MNIDALVVELKRDEGVRNKPYKDTVGKITIGVGRNLDDVGLSNDEVESLLRNDIARVKQQLDKNLPWWTTLNDTRQRVLANMCFNLGIGGLMGFDNTLAAIKTGNYADASRRMLDSKWAKQVGARAVRLAKMMESGSA